MNPQSASADSPDPAQGARRSWRTPTVCAAAALLIAGSAAAYWWSTRAAKAVSGAGDAAGVASSEEDDASPPPHDPQAVMRASGYVGSQACAACHSQRVKEFSATRHFRSSRLPKAEEMPQGFQSGAGGYATRDPALSFEMKQEGDDFLQTAIRQDPRGPLQMSQKIALVYGGQAGDEVYHYWHGNRLFQLPIAWMHPIEAWINAPGYQDGTADFSRPTSPRCVECHTTWMYHAAGTPNQYDRQTAILGVTCERCHGPGREHVAFHEEHPNQNEAQAIVHPAELPPPRQLEVCTQCHSNANKPRQPAFSYRPGEVLDDYFRSDTGNHPEHDHTANQADHMKQSQCFIESKTLTCTTCHDPHLPEGPENAGSIQKSCLGCHQPDHCADRPQLPQAIRDDCIGCHMPKREVTNVWFSTAQEDFVSLIERHDHRIAVHPIARSELLLRHYRQASDPAASEQADQLESSLVDHWLAEAQRYRQEYRFLAAIGAYRQAIELRADPGTRERLDQTVAVQVQLDELMRSALRLMDQGQFAEAMDKISEVLELKPDFAAAHGRMGTLLAQAGRREEAVEHLQGVAAHDPDDAYGLSMLGWLAYLDGNYSDSVEFYRRADAIEPFNAKNNYHMGLSLAASGRFPEAVERFEQVARIEPNHVEAIHGLAMALREQGKTVEAAEHAQRAARMTRYQHLGILRTLAESHAESGNYDQAIETARRALETARKLHPNLVKDIQQRLDEFQAQAKTAR